MPYFGSEDALICTSSAKPYFLVSDVRIVYASVSFLTMMLVNVQIYSVNDVWFSPPALEVLGPQNDMYTILYATRK